MLNVLKIMSDTDMFLFIEKDVRGGVTHTALKYTIKIRAMIQCLPELCLNKNDCHLAFKIQKNFKPI